MFKIFEDLVSESHKYLREWSEDNPDKKIVATLCTYIPEEILYAGNIIPTRILPDQKSIAKSSEYIQPMYCTYCRSCVTQGISGDYDFVDGIIFAHCCLHMRQAYWILRDIIDPQFKYYMSIPHLVQNKYNEASMYGYYRTQILDFKRSVEKWIGKRITNNDLRRGIETVNQNRLLLKEVYNLRKGNNPLLTGAEALLLVMCSQIFDKSEINREISKILPKLKQRKTENSDKIRLMWVGSEFDDIPLIKSIEELNAIFVTDDNCNGTRYFWDLVDTSISDPVKAVVLRYAKRVPCPSKDWPDGKRLNHIVSLAKDWNVQAAILIRQKFCDPHGFDLPFIKERLERECGIPSYQIEVSNVNSIGALKTRIEAFLETLEMGLEDELWEVA